MNDATVKAPAYQVKGSDVIRGDEIIASFQNGKLTALPGCERFQIQASRAWNAASTKFEQKIVLQDGEDSGIPPCPQMNPLLGDKTPEVVRWYQNYHPEEFARRYTGRVFKA
jgi:hypothetical protein